MDTSNLKSLIKKSLYPLVSSYSKTVYLDLPFHTNLGDLLIWLGTEYFLKENSINCTYRNSVNTSRKLNIQDDSLIFLHGGGNFGDVWREHQEFRIEIIKNYPRNRIILLPQTVFYSDRELMKKDAEILSQHKDLYLCARDNVSYNILKENFKNKIILVPDMAFYIPQEPLKHEEFVNKKSLYIKRVDGEINLSYEQLLNKIDCENADWPTIGNDKERFKKFYSKNIIYKLIAICYNFEQEPIDRFLLNWYIYNYLCKLNIKFNYILENFINKWASKRLLQSIFDIGIQFLSTHEIIYSSRLHVCILCSIMDRTCLLLDNSYGKNYNFYNTWLKEDLKIRFINQ